MTAVQTFERKGIEAGHYLTTNVLPALKNRLDNSLVRYDAWFIVFVAVLLALGATLLAGMAVWCVVKRHGRFTGSWQWESGIKVSMECA